MRIPLKPFWWFKPVVSDDEYRETFQRAMTELAKPTDVVLATITDFVAGDEAAELALRRLAEIDAELRAKRPRRVLLNVHKGVALLFRAHLYWLDTWLKSLQATATLELDAVRRFTIESRGWSSLADRRSNELLIALKQLAIAEPEMVRFLAPPAEWLARFVGNGRDGTAPEEASTDSSEDTAKGGGTRRHGDLSIYS